MPAIEGLGPAVAEGLEAGVKKLGGDVDNPVLKFTEHFFSPESQMTGKSGKLLFDTVQKGLYPEVQRQESIITKAAQQSGLPVDPVHIRQKAVSNAADSTYGKNREHLAAIMDAVNKEHGPGKVKQLTDAMGIILQETQYGPPAVRTSKTASLLARDPRIKDAGINLRPSPYISQGKVESAITKGTVGALAPYTAVWHSAQAVLNSTLNSHASSMVKALDDIWSGGYENNKAQLTAQNVLGDTLLREYTQKFKFDHGIIAKYAPNSIGEFLHKNILTPGLSYVMNVNNVYSALVGKHEAQWAAKQVTDGGWMQKFGANKLNDLGIDWQGVLKNGGLSQAEEEQAMRRVIQQNMHTEAGGARARFVATTPLGRTLTVFHRYATMEGRLITKRIFETMSGKHDPLMAIQIMASIGIAFPTAGFFINDMLKAATGQQQHPIDAFTKQEGSYLEGKDFADALLMIGRMGAGGVMYDYANAAAREKLQSAVLGASTNMVLEAGGDLMEASTSSSHGAHKWDKFKRDLLRDVPSYGYGARLAHELLPTAAERNAAKPMTARRVKAQQAAQRRKAREAQ